MYRLARDLPRTGDAPTLDPWQQAVVQHPGGPLLVLAGPGTGKTSTVVECAVDRIQRRGIPAERVVVLTFSRRAAADLRARITSRLGRTVTSPIATTFHAFCYGLVRRFADRLGMGGPDGPAVRLLTGPEQEFRVRETLHGSPETGRAHWPESLEGAYPTRAFAAEVRAVLARARQLGMDPDDVVAAGAAAQRPEWVAVGEFFEEYLDVLDAEGVLDYAELVHRCRILLADPQVVARLRSEIDFVAVDEYHDTDPAQIRLLQAIAGDGRDLVVAGDPDQSIFAFRGAEARGILDFPDAFPTRDGARAPVLALGRSWRLGAAPMVASRGVADRLGLPRALPSGVAEAFRRPLPNPSRPGLVQAFSCTSPGAEAEHIAHLLRSARLRDGLAWDQMAVLVRSGRAAIPALSRALVAAGVPVEVAGDEIPLGADPAVRPLLLALHVASRARPLGADEAHLLLTSPLGGLDSMAVRRLGRRLRAAERAELGGAGLPRPSTELIVAALRDPELVAELNGDVGAVADAARARTLAELIRRCDRAIRDGATAEEALWLLWSETEWPSRLAAEAAHSGEPGRRANRDLDAICALFDIAHRSEEMSGLRGVTGFLAEVEGQQIPADTLRESDVRGGAVRLLTAHRAKGLEWELVVVAGVQEGAWPDVARRGSLLEPDQLGRSSMGVAQPTAARIAEERRLFYVACTRARTRLVVTTVTGTEGEGDQPSRFVGELGVALTPLPGRPRRPLTLAALVGELRRVSVDPDSSPSRREQAALRLARLADATDGEGRPLAAVARPERWWGMRRLSEAGQPASPPDEPVQLSGSQLASVLACPRQWFLARRAQAEPARRTAAGFGSVVHVLAEHGAHHPTSADALAGHLESVWDQLDFDAHWLSAVERAEAEAAVERFVSWQQERHDLELIGTELRFACEVDLGFDRVRLTGIADRVERQPDGRIRVVDFKTSRTPPSGTDVALHDQLGVYQLAVQQGAFDDAAGRPGGAELVYLRLPDGPANFPRVFHQPSLDDVPYPVGLPDAEGDDQLTEQPSWVHHRLAQAVRVIREERHEARVGAACRWCAFRASCPAQSTGKQLVT